MKLNLKSGNDIRLGYLNVDRFPADGVEANVYRQGDIGSLDWLVEDSQVDEIIAMDCLEHLPTDVIQSAITNWCNKLAKDGILKIMALDCYAVAKAFSQGQLNLEEFSKAILGTKNENKLSSIDAITLLAILKESGLDISLKRYEGISLYVEATKC